MRCISSLVMLLFVLSSCRQAPPAHEYHWKAYSPQAIQESIAQHKPVVIDFWAEWCPNCHDLERTVFSLPDIQAKLGQVTALRMDVTNQEDPQVQSILDRFQIEGVPTIVFLDRQGKEVQDARVIGLVTPQEFSQAFALLNVLQ